MRRRARAPHLHTVGGRDESSQGETRNSPGDGTNKPESTPRPSRLAEARRSDSAVTPDAGVVGGERGKAVLHSKYCGNFTSYLNLKLEEKTPKAARSALQIREL